MLSRANLAAIALTLLATGGLAIGARCASATRVSCSFETLTGDAPKLDVPYAGTRPEIVRLMLDLGRVRATDTVVDLGTGDGRMLLAAASRGASGVGVDIDPVLVRQARAQADRLRLSNRVDFRVEDLFQTPLADADLLTLFLLPRVNLRLRPRILNDMRPGARVVSHAFDMNDWTPDAQGRVGGARVFLWIVPARVPGRWWLAEAGQPPALLDLTQHYQMLGGHLGAIRIEGRIKGTEVRFTAGDRTYTGRIEGQTITGPNWSAQLVDTADQTAPTPTTSG